MARATTIVLLAALNFIVPDGSKIMLLAVADISEARNAFANASSIEGMTTGWFKTINAPHNHFPSFAVRSLHWKVL
jgi:hypothetical protein